MTEQTCTDPNPVPRDGASIVVLNEYKVLLVKRGRVPAAGLWSLPGGKTEEPESPRETARRELKEETGIDADVEGVLDRVTVAAPGEQRYRLTVFYGRPTGGDLKAGGDADSAEWVHLNEVETRPMTEGTAELIWTAAHRLRS
jgi:8-oxo-dGTP diphosphatase